MNVSHMEETQTAINHEFTCIIMFLNILLKRQLQTKILKFKKLNIVLVILIGYFTTIVMNIILENIVLVF